ncbi:MAG: PrsW family glutamic-type intramembrane protease [Candidatus Eisenbacteria bacterium]
MISSVWSLVAGFVPVIAFLLGLQVMDSYKLVHRRALLLALATGVGTAMLAYLLNSALLVFAHLPDALLRAWIAPVLEEALKAAVVAWLIHTDRVGFVVDAALFGFAIGAGFAVAENFYYAGALHDYTLTLWLVRGLGTAVMHGSTTALFAIVGKALADREAGPLALLPGFGIAAIVHAAFNQISANPFVTTAILLGTMPVLLLAAFEYSERATREWLSSGFDSEMQMLEMILDGEVENTPVGRFLETLRHRFEPIVVADLLCLLTIHLELSLRAKGMLIARSVGVDVPVDDSVRANLEEMKYLEKAVGPTGCLAIMPLRRTSRRDLWQILLLERASSS